MGVEAPSRMVDLAQYKVAAILFDILVENVAAFAHYLQLITKRL